MVVVAVCCLSVPLCAFPFRLTMRTESEHATARGFQSRCANGLDVEREVGTEDHPPSIVSHHSEVVVAVVGRVEPFGHSPHDLHKPCPCGVGVWEIEANRISDVRGSVVDVDEVPWHCPWPLKGLPGAVCTP